MEELEFKPNVSRIFFGRLIGDLIVLFILIGIFIGLGLFMDFLKTYGTSEGDLISFNVIKYSLYGLFGFFVLMFVFSFINLIGNTLTTKYTINENYIIRKTTFLNEIEEDIPIKQITNSDYTISWFWDKIFGTGSIAVYTSGSIGADMYFYGINSVNEIYDNIKSKIDSFRKEIIAEKEVKLLKIVKPNVAIAVFFTLIRLIVSYSIVSFYLFSLIGSFVGNYFLIFIVVVFFILLVNVILSVMAYNKKEYNFYTDKLEYYDGFLTFHKVSVPLERITNVDLVRTLFDRIFGVSSIRIETAGSGLSEIIIGYVSDGETIVSELKEVLKKHGRN